MTDNPSAIYREWCVRAGRVLPAPGDPVEARWQREGLDYDGMADLAASIAEGFRAVRERVAKGGPGWVPK